MKKNTSFLKAVRYCFVACLLLLAESGVAQNTLNLAGLSASSTAKVAYSLRKLSSSYSGSAIQVRRSSDNATQDIGFDGSGNLDQSALTTFVGSNDGFITKWYDQSGNGNDAVQSTAGDQPQIVSSGTVLTAGSRPTIKFNGTTFIDGGTSAYSITGAHSLSAVYNFQSGTVQHIIDRVLTGGGNPLTSITGSNQGQYRNDAGSLLTVGSTQTPPFSNTFTATWDASNNINHYKNGVSDYSGSLSLPATLDIMRIGRHFSITGTAVLNIWEVILFPSSISTSERKAMECNQQVYYGITTMPAAITGNTTLSTAITTTLADATSSGTWSSVSTGVATIGTSGVVTGVSAGTSVISYTMASGCAATTTVNVTTPQNALLFDGTDDRVLVNSGLGYDLSNKSFTVEFWAKRNGSGSEDMILGQGTSTSNRGLHIGFNSINVMRFGFFFDDLDASSSFVDNNWHHWAFTFDDATLQKIIYRDGIQVASGTASGHFLGNGSSDLYIGDTWAGTANHNGHLDELRIWSTIRSQAQLAASMNCDVTPQSGLEAYYRFNQGTASGTNTAISGAYDYSGNGHCGTITNFALTGGTSNYVTGAVGTCITMSDATPSSFSGNTPVCVGSTITLSNANTGGIWSTASGNITINSTSGLVTGVTAGTATVNYTLRCNTLSTVVTINALPVVAAITGNTTLSTVITTDLDDATGGGVWTSAATGTATINSTTGVVTGVSAGTALISYTVTTSGCSTTVTTNVTVNTPQNALLFDGTNDRVLVNSGLGYDLSNKSFTIEFWAKRNGSGSDDFVLGQGASSNSRGLHIGFNSVNSMRFAFWADDLDASSSFVDNNWHHWAFTFDDVTRQRIIYRDGIQVASGTASGHFLGNGSSDLYIGDLWTGTHLYNGHLDEFRIWSTVRSQAQVAANMNCDVAQQAGLQVYFRFDQGTASGTNTGLTCAYDYSGNNHTGTLSNFALSGGSSNYVTGTVGSCNSISLPTPGTFSGNSPVCVGQTITLANTSTGGIWSTASGNITLNSTSGLVTGVTAGTATVNYTLNCSSSSVIVTINALPTVAAITGTTTLTLYNTTTLANATSSGVWSSSATGVATVNSTSGVVTGVSEGTATISYTVTSSGCSATATANVTVSGYNGIKLDGSNDYMITPDLWSSFSSGSASMTVDLWFKANAAGDVVVEKGAGGVGSGWHDTWIEVLGTGEVLVRVWSLSSVSLGFISFGTWHHAAIRYNGATNKLDGVLDGVASSSTVTGGWSRSGSALFLLFGVTDGTHLGSGAYLNGVIDEIRIWNRWLCDGEIANDMAGRVNGSPTGLVAHYTLDQGIGGGTNTGLTTAIDYSGNGRNATLVNSSLSGSSSNWITGTVNALAPVYTSPTISAGSNVTICNGTSTSLTASGGTSYSWAPSTGLSVTTGSSVTASPTSTITYTVTDACGGTATVQVSVNPAPTTSGGSNVAICAGGNTALSASGASTYVWSPAASLSASTGTNVTATPTVTTIYTVTGTSAIGCSNAATVTVTVTPYSGVYAITGGGPYCSGTAGATIGLSSSDAGYNYQLIKGGTTPIGSPVAGTGAAISFGAQPLAGLYTATVTSVAAPGCVNSMSGSATVSILSSPASVAVTGGGSVCGGGPGVPVGLAGSAIGVQYQLYLGGSPVGGPVGGVGSGFNFGIFTTLGTYTATATNTVNACTSNMTGSVVINAAAGITTYTVTGTGSYCSGGTGVAVGLNSSTSGISYQLFHGGTTAIGSPVIGTGGAISFGLQTTAGTYTVVGTNTTTGCFGTMTGSAVISINPLPAIWAVTGGGVYCSGGTGVPVGLSLGDVGVNYQLYIGATPTGSPVAGAGTAVSFGLQTAAGTYTVIATDGATTCTNTMGGSVTVSVNPLPTVIAGGATTVCAGSPTPLTVSGASTYAWSPAATLSATTGSSVTASPIATTTYTVAGTDVNGCVNTDAVTVTVNPLPSVSGGSDVAICTGSSTGLTATGAATYVWAPSATLSASTGASVTANPTSTTTYTVTGTDVNSCVNTATVTVSVNPLPTVSGGSNVGICTGASTGLTASGASTYTWAPGASLSATTGTSVTATPGLTTTYTVTGTDANGCVNEANVTVSVNPLPTVSGGSDVAICTGSSTVLTASGATTYIWTPAAGLSATTGTSVTASPTITTTYTVTGSTSGCNNTATVTVTVNPLPSVSAGTATTVCAGVSAGLTASGAVSYIWVPSASLSASTGTSVTATPSSTTIYTVSGTDANGCVNTATVMVSVNPLPSVSTGAGSVICATASATVTASGAASYTWSPAGTLSASTGASVTATPTVTTTYTVTGTSAASCTNTASVTITVNPLPTDYAMTGGGSFCSATSGTPIGVANSDVGTDYQLYRSGFGAVGSPVAGTGAAISFGLHTVSGTYTVVATNATTGCSRTLSTSTTLTSYLSPAIVSVTGGGSYCVGGTGVAIGLAASAVGVNYQLMLGATPVGSPVAGVGSSLSFGSITTAGTYTVTATNPVSGCTNPMSGSATVSVYSALTSYTVTGGGSYCSGGGGMVVGLSGTTTGVNYQLYLGGSPLVGTTLAGTGAALSFGPQTTAGTYTVVATHATNGCTATMSGSAVVVINALPTAYTVTGGGSYCSGGAGVSVGISNSDAGVDYQLYVGAATVGGPVAGTGAAINFGTFTTAGIYTVIATNTSTSCTNTMSGSAVISINSLPTIYTVSGGGSYCSGAGINIFLGGSNAGINYQIYNGASPVGSPVSGTGGGLTFGPYTTPGTYTVIATNATTSCASNMSGSGTIVGVSLPTAYTVTGGGSYCSGSTGLPVGLSNSDAGINYQLYRGVTTFGSPLAGTGSALAFGTQTTAGTYTVVATNATLGCTSTMTGSAVVSVNPLPVAVSVTGGGSYCSGGAGVAVGLTGSAVGINYQLYNGASTVGSPVGGVGAAFNFGTFTTAGTYTVTATSPSTGCTNNMSGSATISVNSLPTVYSVTGGGSFCSGSTGVAVGLSNSQSGTNYQLYNGASPVGSPVSGTGIAITFGIQTTAGIYTVVATNASTGCTSNMSGSATVTVNSLPNLYTVTGGGAYCSGGAGASIGLSNSDAGVNYQLYNGALAVGSPVAGTGSAFNFGTYTLATTYTVTATNATTGCIRNMSGSATVSVNTLPAAVPVTGGGTICIGGAGVAVGLSASAIGVNYQLYVGATPTGSPVSGVGGAISFGLQTTVGTYTVIGTNATTGCFNTMSGSAVINNYAPPTAFAVTGTGGYCSGGTGLTVGLSGSATGVTYQLFRGASAIGSPVSGTGSVISFGLQTIAGTYTVVGTTVSTGCTGNMSGSAIIVINPLPGAYTVTGGGGYCSGGSGVSVGLSNSDIGVDYQLYRGVTSVGSPVAGTGSAISFGLQTTAGTYTVVATNTTTTCTNNMTGSAAVFINALPTAYTVTGGGSYCSGPGVHIYVSNSDAGVNYQLWNGGTPIGSPVAGTGATLDMGAYTTVATYSVTATNTTTGCSNNMTGSASITGSSLPAVYAVTGGGNYCSGGTGVVIGVANSDISVDYQLYLGATPVGSPVAGTGSAIPFGLQTAAGTYTVLALNLGSSCTQTMSGSATVTIDPPPTAYTVSGGGTLCAGGTGVAVSLSGSDAGTDYQLKVGATPVGSPVSGTGSALNFGLQTTSGTYTVVATDLTSTCSATMTGSAVVSVNPLPSVSAGSGSVICATASATLTASGASSYTWSPSATLSASTGASVTASPTITTTYTVTGTSGAGCNNTATVTVTVNPLPTDYAFTGGGTYCAGGSGYPIGLVNSDAGVTYQLYRTTISGTVLAGTLSGTGSALSLGIHTLPGTYTVVATNVTTGCSRTLTGSTTIVVSAPPAAVTMTGGGSYCPGGAGAAIGLAASAVGVNYQLWLGATPVGSPVPGVGSGLSFGVFTTVGTYSVTATSTITGCSANMSGTATVSIYTAISAFTVTGGGGYCSGGTGVAVGLSSTVTGTNYQLYRSGTPLPVTIAGTGSTISFGLQTTAGTYTVVATNTSTGCSAPMSGSATVTVNSLPTAFTVTGGGSYCTGGSGVAVGLSSSTSGVNYQLYRGVTSVGSPVAGTGSAISFGNQTTAGTYTVVATNATSGCTNSMSGSVTVTVNSLPFVFTVGGGGTYCAGGSTGPAITLSGSTGLTTYQLYLGSTPVGSPVSGTGGGLNFGTFTGVGTYSVSATSTATGCTNAMSGTATVSTISLPIAYTVTGGGSYCTGSTGVTVGLSGSNTGITYQLYRGITFVSSLTGTGSPLNFGLFTTAGTYTVVAYVTSTSCTANMTGSAIVAINSLPFVFSLTGGGSYCAGGAGVAVGLSSSVTGTNYQLYRGGSPVGSPVPGTGTALSFGLQTTAGIYTVVATNTVTGCTANMSGTATVTVNALPTVYSMTGGGNYCSGGSGVAVGLSGSQAGVNYQLYISGSPTGSPVAGTGSAISFGLKTAAGTYTVVATNATTSCTANMTGSATVSINALPTVFTVTGGGAYCSGGAGVSIGLGGSQTGVNYQLYRGTGTVGSPVAGTGSAINFGNQTITGTYTVTAVNATTSCTANMTGSATVSINAAPTICSMTGGGAYCSGGTGVAVGLGASISGVSYQLYLSGSPIGSPVGGVGGTLSFGNQTAAGTYTAVATNATGCSSTMSGSVTVSINSLPFQFSVTGGGGYCAGGTGIGIGLSGSVTGTTYKVYLSGTPVTSPVSGTGAGLNFGLFTSGGTYTVIATNSSTGCTQTMSGSAIVTVNPVPTYTSTRYTVAPAGVITLNATPSGGNWVSAGPSTATIGSASGIVTGVALGTTTVTYTLSTGCFATHLLYVTPTGFREAGTTTVQNVAKIGDVYLVPNPTRSAFTVKAQLVTDDKEVNLQITNMLGQVVYNQPLEVKDGELNGMVQLPYDVPNGMYLVTLRTTTDTKVFHLAIEK